MTKLEQLIKELCPNGVEYKKLSDIATVARGVRVVRDQLAETGEIPVYQNSIKPLGYHDKSNVKAYSAFVIGAGAAGEIGFSDVDFWAADDCYYFLCPDNLNNRYLYFVLMKNQPLILSRVRKASIPRLSRNFIENLVIPVPPLEVQAEIVKVLDKYTESVKALQQELEKELTARKKQYEYYRDSLMKNSSNASSACVTDICDDVFLGLTSKVDYVQEGGIPLVRANNMTNGVLSFNDVKYISEEQHKKLTKNHKVKKGDILISKSGTLGIVCIVDTEKEFSIYESLICLRPNNHVYNRFLLHFLRSTEVQRIMLEKKVGNAIQHLNLQTFRKLYLKIPTLTEQERIVSILDRFDKLCNDISEGLPAEIEARRKQYEYYRDKLLSFKEA